MTEHSTEDMLTRIAKIEWWLKDMEQDVSILKAQHDELKTALQSISNKISTVQYMVIGGIITLIGVESGLMTVLIRII